MKQEFDIESLLRLACRECSQSEIFASFSSGIEVSAESGVFSDITEEDSFGFCVRVIKRGKVGFSFGNRADKFSGVLSRAIANSSVGQKLASLPPKARWRRVPGLFDRRVARIDGKGLIDRLEGLVAAAWLAGAWPTYAGVECGTGRTLVANTNGVFGDLQMTSIGGGAYASAGESTGFEGRSSRRDDLDIPSFGRIAGERAVESKDGREIASMRRAKILLHPYAVEGLVSGMLLAAVDGENVFRKSSKLAGKLGKKLFSPELTVIDDGILRAGLGSSPLDSEGVPCRRKELVRGGVLKSFLYPWDSARRAGAKPTGNGFRGPSSQPKAAPTNLVIGRGGTKANSLEAGADFSVLWFSGTHTANPFSGDFTLEMKNSFSLKGKRTPVKYGLVAGNLFDVLKTARPAADKVEVCGNFISPPVLVEADVIAKKKD